jgi:CBS domain-containing protein
VLVKVREIMTSPALSVGPETSVNEIARLMVERDISGVPVLDGAGRLLGLVTELDLIARHAHLDGPAFFRLLEGWIPLESPAHYQERVRHVLGTLAREVMSTDIASVGPDDDMETLADLLLKRRANPVPVVEDDRLVGIVSRADIVRMMAREVQAAKG